MRPLLEAETPVKTPYLIQNSSFGSLLLRAFAKLAWKVSNAFVKRVRHAGAKAPKVILNP